MALSNNVQPDPAILVNNFFGVLNAMIDAQREAHGLKTDTNARCASCISSLATLALFIIGCVAAGNAFPDNGTLGWVTLGLGGGAGLLTLASRNWTVAGFRKQQIILEILTAAILITLGALGGAGLLSNAQLGWGIIGTALSGMCASSYCCPDKQYRLVAQIN